MVECTAMVADNARVTVEKNSENIVCVSAERLPLSKGVRSEVHGPQTQLLKGCISNVSFEGCSPWTGTQI